MSTHDHAKACLITKWFFGKYEYRLLAVANYTSGYEDRIILERDDKDTLGGSKWVSVAQWAGADSREAGEEDFRALTALVKKLLSERDQRERMASGHA